MPYGNVFRHLACFSTERQVESFIHIGVGLLALLVLNRWAMREASDYRTSSRHRLLAFLYMYPSKQIKNNLIYYPLISGSLSKSIKTIENEEQTLT